ncbi:hypothetical protein ACIHIX_37335 [Streptomyces sp. NPDC051913]|uniref:hypothetical protein n=1 Tax=Streptomyces sp. NPDC051913 TaxID=3365676 RepID=UPI0037CF8393
MTDGTLVPAGTWVRRAAPLRAPVPGAGAVRAGGPRRWAAPVGRSGGPLRWAGLAHHEPAAAAECRTRCQARPVSVVPL